MTRKRFIKLAMSKGLQKREAELLATTALGSRGSYSEFYNYYFPTIGNFDLSSAMQNLNKAIKTLGEQFRGLVEKISLIWSKLI